MTRKERYQWVIEHFLRTAPDAETELFYSNPYELLVAVVLSAQCTDKRVNLTTPRFFERFPTAESLSRATVEEVFELIRSISYPNNKAKHLVGLGQMLHHTFKDVVPSEINDLVKLPGVGRKTANVIASVIFDKPAMAVDTHVFRVSARMGLTQKARTPLEAERQLVKYLPEHLVSRAHHWLILHGRYVCVARKPKCGECALQEACQYYQKQQRKLALKTSTHVTN
ncbi:MAG: endonuclease III [Bacteroidia bacterium]